MNRLMPACIIHGVDGRVVSGFLKVSFAASHATSCYPYQSVPMPCTIFAYRAASWHTRTGESDEHQAV